jgi:hypothetical protein
MNLRTTTLAAALLAAGVLSLPGSAQAAPWGWQFGAGVAAGAVIGGALAAPYYGYPYYAYPVYPHRVYIRPRVWLY